MSAHSTLRNCERCLARTAVFGERHCSKCLQVLDAQEMAGIRKRQLAMKKKITKLQNKTRLHRQAQTGLEETADELDRAQREHDRVVQQHSEVLDSETFEEITQTVRRRRAGRSTNPNSVFVQESPVGRRSNPRAGAPRAASSVPQSAPAQPPPHAVTQTILASYHPIPDQTVPLVVPAPMPSIVPPPIVLPPAPFPVQLPPQPAIPLVAPPSPTSEVLNSFGEIDVNSSDDEDMHVDVESFCSICQNVEAGLFTSTLCNHAFHEDCLAKHKATAQPPIRCPVCNQHI